MQKNPFADIRIPVWVAMLVIALMPGLVFGPPLLSGKTIGPFDQMRHMVLGESAEQPQTDRAWDILQADGALQFYGWRNLVFQAHKKGQMPLWNPNELAGTPLLANSQSAPYYPLHLVPIANKGIATGPYLVFLAWFHLSVAGLGVFCLARRLGAGVEGALFGGVAMALSPFAVSWSALPSVMTACCWIPVVLAAQSAAIQNPGTKSWLGLCGAALMLFSAGHLQFVFYGGLAWTVFGAVSLVASLQRPNIVMSLLASVSALALGVAMAWPQIGPTLAFSKLSHRKAVANEEGYAAYAASAIQPWEFLGTTTPVFMGTPGHFDAEDVEGKIPSTWMMYVKPGGNYAESAIWLGTPVILGLCLLGRRTDWRRLAPLAAVGATGLLLALGTPLARLFYFGIPGFASTGSPGRAAILFVLAACTMAAVAVPAEPTQSNPKAKALAYFALLGIALASILASTQMGGLKTWLPIELNSIVARRMVEAIPFLIGSLIAAAGAWYFWAKRGWLAVGTICAVAAHLVAVPLGVLPFSDPPKAVTAIDPGIRTAYINEKWDFFAAPRSALMPPNFATIYGTPEIGGYDSLMAKSSVDILREINRGEDAAPPTNGNMMFVKSGFDADALAAAGVTRVCSKFSIPDLLEERTLGEAHIYALPGPGIATAGDKPLIVTANTEGFRLSGPMDGHVVARFANLPGWRATQAGKDLPIGSGRWLEVEPVDRAAPIDFKYLPPGLPSPSLVMSLAYLNPLVAVLSLLAQAWKPKKPNSDRNPVESGNQPPDPA